MNSKQHEIIKRYVADKTALKSMKNSDIARELGVAPHAVSSTGSPTVREVVSMSKATRAAILSRLELRAEITGRSRHPDLMANTGMTSAALEKILRKMRSGQEVVVTEDSGREVGGPGVNAWLMRPWVKIGEAA